ncbi:MAG: alpha-hydroxy-acid oxidizing protein [Silicimonas sp.]|jgi:L-lactate dehydrogenase (cytochrome)|nr:alpha-hydroxy-acid oxidizing protein [Silicimonas sp.]
MDLDTRFPAISDLRARAKRRIPHFVFEYLDSATGREDQHRRNQSALADIKFWPSILDGEHVADLSTTFLGREYPLPFGCAPVGMSGIMWPGAEKLLAKGCSTVGIPYCMSTVATVVPETLAPFIGDQGWFQLYMPKDKEIRSDMVRRAKEAGFHSLILTVDVPSESRRERQRRANLTIPPKVNAAMVWSMMTHPEWTIGTLKEGIPSLKFCEDYAKDMEATSVAHAGHVIRGNPTWDDIAWMREKWEGPLLVKGIQKPEDAIRLMGLGVDAIWVSNHSGRQFDGGPASIECLADIRAAVPDAPIVFDSGVTGGLDILRALALGADFVMLGRAFHYAVGALGAKGPEHLVQILEKDMRSCMAQIGARDLKGLSERLFRPAP